MADMQAFFQVPLKPTSSLAWHRILSPTTSIKVSPVALGGSSYFVRNEDAAALLDTFHSLGGNFIDTSNDCNAGESERLIGEWMEARSIRDHMVVATKFSSGFIRDQRDKVPLHQGNKHGYTPFSVHQRRWNAAYRDMEAEIIPMCEDQGMAIVPWGVLSGGQLMTAKQREEASKNPEARKGYGQDEKYIRVSKVLERIANTKGVTLHAVALAYLYQQSTYVAPIVGMQTVEHVRALNDAVEVRLSDDEVTAIHEASAFLYQSETRPYSTRLGAADVENTRMAGWINAPPKQPYWYKFEDVNNFAASTIWDADTGFGDYRVGEDSYVINGPFANHTLSFSPATNNTLSCLSRDFDAGRFVGANQTYLDESFVMTNCSVAWDCWASQPPRSAYAGVGGTIEDATLSPGYSEAEGGPRPSSDNLFTHNIIVADNCHAKIMTGKYSTSAYLIDMGSDTGTFVNHGKRGNEKDNFQKLPPFEPVQVESGAEIRLGKDPMFWNYRDTQILCVPAIWSLVIEPVDAAYDKKCEEALRGVPVVRDPVPQHATPGRPAAGSGWTAINR
ncbi:hypothetical protein SLS58_007150 [Diplodia intermedia]|uniref:NADP-dependent oxidoreductase domain-containing protein n=1 Tax=Diplodia intermedia TaxID=856260 RepID=A0ABR3TL64_9PEZI